MRLFLREHKSFLVVLTVSLVYWIYLIFSSKMGIVHDAIGYEYLGGMLYEQGFIKYLETGPHREPLYPLLISLSLRISDLMHVNYHYIQKFFQVIILSVSMILVYVILTRLHINKVVKVILTMYVGISPAIVNASMSLYSEILAMPFVLGIVLLNLDAWEVISHKNTKSVVLRALSISLCFMLAALVKGVFQYVLLAFLLPYFIWIIVFRVKGRPEAYKNTLIFLLLVLLPFQAMVHTYKFLNYKYNGSYQFTNRYADILFAVAYSRAEPITARQFITCMTSIPGTNFCRRFFDDQECINCEWGGVDPEDFEREGIDRFRLILKDEIEGLDAAAQNKKTMKLAVTKIIEHPIRFTTLAGVEFFKIFFWETTRIGFVRYPDWLDGLYSVKWFKDLLRLFLSLFTVLGVFFQVILLFPKRRDLLQDNEEGRKARFCLSMSLIIFCFGGLYALCTVLTRYALPIAPLYIISIAFLFHHFTLND